MVKNKKGGKGHKRGARKHLNSSLHAPKFREAKEEGEMYAKITRIFGGGNAEIICNDGITRLLVIRGKFRGRNKRDNNVVQNAMVLVGVRDWEVVTAGKKPKADLLFVYPLSHHVNFKRLENINPKIMPDGVSNDNNDDNIEFTHDVDDEENEMTNVKITSESKKETENKLDLGDIDFDDI